MNLLRRQIIILVPEINVQRVFQGVDTSIGATAHLNVFVTNTIAIILTIITGCPWKEVLQRLPQTTFDTSVPAQVRAVGQNNIFLIVLPRKSQKGRSVVLDTKYITTIA